MWLSRLWASAFCLWSTHEAPDDVNAVHSLLSNTPVPQVQSMAVHRFVVTVQHASVWTKTYNMKCNGKATAASACDGTAMLHCAAMMAVCRAAAAGLKLLAA